MAICNVFVDKDGTTKCTYLYSLNSRLHKNVMVANSHKCNLCNKIEDEIHFITEYQLYMETRKKFFNEVGISHEMNALKQCL